MNEFTKEELQYINDYIFKGAASIRLDAHDILKDKLKSMINDYLEHDFDGIYPIEKPTAIYIEAPERTRIFIEHSSGGGGVTHE